MTHHPTVFGVDRELNVRSAGIHADFADHPQGGIPHDLILFVRKRLRRRNRNGVTGVNAHGIEIFDGADDHHVVFVIAHHLQLELLPAEDRLFDQDFVYR